MVITAVFILEAPATLGRSSCHGATSLAAPSRKKTSSRAARECTSLLHIESASRGLSRRNNRYRAGHPVGGIAIPDEAVQFIGVYTKPGISAKAMAAHAMDTKLPFRVLRDARFEFAKAYNVTRLSEVIVFDPDWKVIYQGPVGIARRNRL